MKNLSRCHSNRHFGRDSLEILMRVHWSVSVLGILGSLISGIVQGLYAHRLCIFSGARIAHGIALLRFISASITQSRIISDTFARRLFQVVVHVSFQFFFFSSINYVCCPMGPYWTQTSVPSWLAAAITAHP
jgi:hypothetical protein